MRLFALIAAFTLVSFTAHAEGRSLSLNGVDQKLPGSLGKAAETPKVVEAPVAPAQAAGPAASRRGPSSICCDYSSSRRGSSSRCCTTRGRARAGR
jgi:hypothetical protein